MLDDARNVIDGKFTPETKKFLVNNLTLRQNFKQVFIFITEGFVNKILVT